MPAFPGMGYPLVPGYESVGRGPRCRKRWSRNAGLARRRARCSFLGPVVSAPCAGCSAAPRRGVVVDAEPGWSRSIQRIGDDRACCSRWPPRRYHAIDGRDAGTAPSFAPPELVVGHGVLGRLLARLSGCRRLPAADGLGARRRAPRRRRRRLCRACTRTTTLRRDYRPRSTTRAATPGDRRHADRRAWRRAASWCWPASTAERVSFAFAPAFMREARRARRRANGRAPDLLAVKRPGRRAVACRSPASSRIASAPIARACGLPARLRRRGVSEDGSRLERRAHDDGHQQRRRPSARRP